MYDDDDEDHDRFTTEELVAMGRVLVRPDEPRCSWRTGHHGQVRCQLAPKHHGGHFAFFAGEQVVWLNLMSQPLDVHLSVAKEG